MFTFPSMYFLKKKLEDFGPSCGGHRYSYFGLLMTSALGSKARVDSLACMLCRPRATDSTDSSLVQHLLTSWRPVFIGLMIRFRYFFKGLNVVVLFWIFIDTFVWFAALNKKHQTWDAVWFTRNYRYIPFVLRGLLICEKERQEQKCSGLYYGRTKAAVNWKYPWCIQTWSWRGAFVLSRFHIHDGNVTDSRSSYYASVVHTQVISHFSACTFPAYSCWYFCKLTTCIVPLESR